MVLLPSCRVLSCHPQEKRSNRLDRSISTFAVRRKGEIAVGPHEPNACCLRHPDCQEAVELHCQRLGRVLKTGRPIPWEEKDKLSRNLTATHEIFKRSLSSTFDDRTVCIGNAEPGQPVYECMLKCGEVRNRRDERIAKKLRKHIRRSHHFRQAIGGLDHISDDRETFLRIAVEKLFATLTPQTHFQLPNQIPDVVQARIHPLSAKGTMYVSRITGEEYAAFAQARCVTMMNSKIAAPMKRGGLNFFRRTFAENPLRQLKTRGLAFRMFNRSYYAPTSCTHRENSHRPFCTRAELHFVAGKVLIGFNIGEHEWHIVVAAFERDAQRFAHAAVRAVAADNKCSLDDLLRLHRVLP